MKTIRRLLLLIVPLCFAFALGCGGGNKVEVPTGAPPAKGEKPATSSVS